MKGLVVVICAPTQGGKDFIAQETMKNLGYFDYKTSYATSYKTREPREDDPEHIHCVVDESEIPIEQSDKIEATIYGDQKIVYDKAEIAQKLANGEIVFIATGSPELAKKVKAEFKTECVSVFVKRQQVHADIMLEEDLKRHGIKPEQATEEQVKESRARVGKRLSEYESMKPALTDFVHDEELGADYIFRNWYTLMGGSWNSKIDQMAESEFFVFANKLMAIFRFVNSSDDDWRNFASHNLSQEERQVELFTMQDEWIEYIKWKHENEC